MENISKNDEKKLVEAAAQPRRIYKRFEADDVGIEALTEALGGALEGCRGVYLLCLTLGAQVDRLIRSLSLTDPPKAALCDEAASALTLRQAMLAEQILEKECRGQGQHLTERLSPGLCGLPLSLNFHILRLLGAPKKIGLFSNDAHLLIPQKSITAVYGATDTERKSKTDRCALCRLREDCRYRKEGHVC